MKNLNKYFLTIIIIVISLKISYATEPGYILKVENVSRIDSNTMDFDIFIRNSDSGTNNLKYLLGQYVLKLNPSFANSGTLSMSIAPGSNNEISDLPAAYFPGSLKVMRSTLIIGANPIPDDTTRPLISSAGSGTKVIKIRLKTTASSFAGEPDFRWKNAGSGVLSTKLGLLVNNAPVKLTDSTSHVIGSQTGLAITVIPEGYLYAASINTTRSNIKDKTRISLRSPAPPYSIVDADSVEIDSVTQTGNCIFNNASPGNYYVVVQYKNSLETWSANPVSITAGSNSYDFTTASSKALGNNMVLKLGKWCLYSGDVTQDGVIDLSDLNDVFNDAAGFLSGNVVSDLNGDEVVDLSDLTIVFNNSSLFVSIIQP